LLFLNETYQAGQYGTKGKASADNYPGARYGSNAVVDSNNNLYIFGGYGYDSTDNLGMYFNSNLFFKYKTRILK
jgi:hypothetical protein